MTSKRPDSDLLRRVRTYAPPPIHFDPHTASQEDLLRHGFPQRPDPKKHPELARLWKRAFARPVRFDEAEVVIDPVMGSRDPLPTIAAVESRWAGVVKLMSTASGSDFDQPATMVFAQWQLPSVFAVSADETLAVAFWVGLDGHPSLSGPASKQVLQAGIAAQVNPPTWPWESASVKWWAWTEWYDAVNQQQACAVKNFPVGPGDVIFAVVCAPQPDFGYVSMMNVTRGIGRSVGIPAPSGITVQGKSAEWIVEIPPDSPHMPYFNPVTFTDCNGGSLQHGVFNLTGGNPTDIRGPGSSSNPYGTALTQTSIASPTVAVVEELGVDWV